MFRLGTISIIIFSVFFIACNDEAIPLPKPRIYPKVVYPDKAFEDLNVNTCPFTLSKPVYFKFKKDSLRLIEEKRFTCWFDLHCAELNSYIHLSYIPIDKSSPFDELVQDAFELANKHNVKASARTETRFGIESKNLAGLIFEIDGPVAAPLQFFVTDSTDHFLRGSLYFNDVVNRDSIQPVYEFLKTDVDRLIESISWTQ